MSSGMQSFYGGPNGQSFYIKKIFETRKDMMEDITSYGWASPISVGEYVLVSYGIPSDPEFQNKAKIDIAQYHSTYNSTLWQKIYVDSNASSATGLDYKLIASMSGYTPRMHVDFTQIHSNELPKYEWDNTDIDNPILKVWYPRSQFIQQSQISTQWIDAGQTANVSWDTSSDDKIDEPYITFYFPKSQVLQKGTTTWLNPDVNPNFDIDSTDINNPILNFQLPRAQKLAGAFREKTNLADVSAGAAIRAEILESGDPVLVRIDGREVQVTPTKVNPVLKIYMPDSQIIYTQNIRYKVLDANKRPYFDFITESRQNSIEAAEDPNSEVYNGTPEEPIVLLALPRAQVLKEGQTQTIHVNDVPRFEIDSSDINNPVVNFWLPVAQNLQQGITTRVRSNVEPSFSIDKTDIDNPVINFELPVAQVQATPDTEWTGPRVQVSVSLNEDDINHPKYTFHLPRAVRFFSGSLLGEMPKESDINRYEVDLNDLPADIDVGDYYANNPSGLIYLAIDKDEESNKMGFAYQANFQAAPPKISSSNHKPYRQDKSKNPATATRSFTGDPSEPWQIDFSLPEIPNVAVRAKFIGATDTGSASVQPSDEETLTFNFEIPSGSRIFAGTDLNKTNQLNFRQPDSHLNDFYLNTKTGILYQQTAMNVWTPFKDSLKGPAGDSLNVVRRYTLIEGSENDGEDTEENTFAKVREKLDEDSEYGVGVDPKPYEIIAVTWKKVRKDENDQPIENEFDYVSYWCFCSGTVTINEETGEKTYTERKWGRALLTGSAVGFISNEYVEESTDRTYSISYINELIGGNFETNSDKKAFSKDQIFNLLAWGVIGEDGKLLDEDGNEYNPGKLPITHDTLSVDETITLMSWGSLAELAL